MIRALLDGRKTQTRRLLYSLRKSKGGGISAHASVMTYVEDGRTKIYQPGSGRLSPQGFPDDHGPEDYFTLTGWHLRKPGDRLWVRETVRADERSTDHCDGIRYKADYGWIKIEDDARDADRWVAINHYGGRLGAWVPSIHMPRWASRLTLVVSAVKIDRLQSISGIDCIAEGIARPGPDHPYGILQHEYAGLWVALHGIQSWADNPWIVALTFTVHKQNIDQMEKAS